MVHIFVSRGKKFFHREKAKNFFAETLDTKTFARHTPFRAYGNSKGKPLPYVLNSIVPHESHGKDCFFFGRREQQGVTQGSW